MLCMLFSSHITYLIAVTLQSTGWVYTVKKFPWYLIYVACSVLDFVLIWQYFLYGTCDGAKGGTKDETALICQLPIG